MTYKNIKPNLDKTRCYWKHFLFYCWWGWYGEWL